MRWLKEEEGATAVLVGLLMVPLIGFGAIVLDVGLIYWETRQLQNGADAAALAIAQDCVDGVVGDCGPFQATADAFTDSNANDGQADAAVQLPGVDGPNSVTVTASTRTVTGTGLSYALAGVLGTGFNETFARSATARWSGIGGGTTIPLIFSTCEWDIFTGGLGAAALPTPVQTIYFHGTGPASANACGGPANSDYPGGFGWLDLDGSGTCTATVSMGQVPGSTGNAPPGPASGPCSYAYLSTLVGQTVLMPIHSTVVGGPGNNAVYTVVGFAAFEVTGYRFGGSQTAGIVPCGNPDRCMGGRFVGYYDLGAEPDDTTPNLGAYTISLTG